MKILLLAATALCPVVAYAQSCPSQSSMTALANATWAQVIGDNVAECGLNGSLGRRTVIYEILDNSD